jgi:iron complex transport system ATP-binding protein
MSTLTSTRPITAAPELELDAVNFGYAETLVVQDVTLALAAGEMVALIGPNGGGKSTLLRLAAGVLRAGAGDVRLGGQAIARLRRDEIARRVAVVPQDFSVQFAYTVREVVGLCHTAAGSAWRVPVIAQWLTAP